jgi:hypothetical protein
MVTLEGRNWFCLFNFVKEEFLTAVEIFLN